VSLISGVALGSSTANSGSWTGITVPTGTKFAVLGVDGWCGTYAVFTTPDAMPTLGSLSMTCPDTGHLQDGSTGEHMGGTFYLINPTVGTGQTLTWDWQAAATFAALDPCAFYLAFFDDVVTSVRSSGGVQSTATTHSPGSLAANSGDLVVACASLWQGDAASVSWTNATKIGDQEATDSYVCLAYAYATGAITITVNSNSTDGGIFAMAMITAAGGGGFTPRMSLLGVG
jgi:hypothetical protein